MLHASVTCLRMGWVCALAVWLCVTVAAPTSADAGPVPLSWSAPSSMYGTHPSGAPSAIACPSERLCVVVDRAGNALVSGDPGSSDTAWRSAAIDAGHVLNAVSCASETLCVAVDDAGEALSSTTPTAGAGAWRSQHIDGESLLGVSCPSTTLCLAVDRAGGVLWSVDPGSGSTAKWASAADIDGSSPLTAISCASASSCVAVDDAGNALASTTPTAALSWRSRAIDTGLALTAVSCSPAGLCVAVDSSGNALASNDPADVAPTWASTNIDPTASLTGVSCPTGGPCVAADQAGDTFASEDVTAAPPTWSASVAEPGVALGGISCVSGAFCVAIDSAGRALTAAIPTPPPASEAPRAGATIVQPHPTIVGIPAVGERLRCLSGVPEESEAILTYAWLRDDSPIANASTSSYRVGGADAQHHLQCQITATDAAGSASGHSAFVAVPMAGVLAAVGETTIGAIEVGHRRVRVPVTCASRAPRGCALALALTTVEVVRGGLLVGISSQGSSSTGTTSRVRVTLGVSHPRLAAGRRATVAVSLNATGRRLLASVRRLPALLTVKGTVIGLLSAVLAQKRLAFAGQPKALVGSFEPTGRVSLLPRYKPVRATRATHLKAVLTPTPYMGWDSYFAFGGRYSEAMILEQASELLALGLQRKGYRYVWLDAGWWQGGRGRHGEIAVNHAQWPHGMAWLTRTLHAAGFRAGIYTDAGREGCGGGHQGSFNHYRQDVNTFASWGFDAVKVDFCGGVRAHLSPQAAYTSFHAAIQANSSHRPMLLSICDFLEPGQAAGAPPFAQSAFASYTFGPSIGNSWRTDTDVGSPGYVTFAMVLRNLDADAAHPEAAGPGHWNDPDYLGPDQGLSAAQFDTQFSMWAMLAAPMMVSDNLTNASPASVKLLTNAEAIAIDQDPAGVQGTLLASSGGGQVWVKPLSDGSRAVALLNRGTMPTRIETSAAQSGMPAAARYALRDVWAHATSATTGAITAEVPGESTVLLRVSASG